MSRTIWTIDFETERQDCGKQLDCDSTAVLGLPPASPPHSGTHMINVNFTAIARAKVIRNDLAESPAMPIQAVFNSVPCSSPSPVPRTSKRDSSAASVIP